MALREGTVVAGFVVERLLGTGGMGAVYRARHPRLERLVALKVLNEALSSDSKARAAFDREAKLAARLDHPNIVHVYDRSESDSGLLWLAMRYVEGGDANSLLAAEPQGLDPYRAVRLITDAAHALDFAHARGILHRDMKPANLLIDQDILHHGERAVLTDFGIARTLDDTYTLSGVAATLAYAAPERFQGGPSDHRADIYSLGCTFYQLLTGQVPFPRADQAAVIAAHLTAVPPAPSAVHSGLPAALDDLIATALAKDPNDRYGSCTDLATAAVDALASAPATVIAPVSSPHRTLPIAESSPGQRVPEAVRVPDTDRRALRPRKSSIARRIGIVVVALAMLAAAALAAIAIGHAIASRYVTVGSNGAEAPTSLKSDLRCLPGEGLPTSDRVQLASAANVATI
ncbi:serine/threonine-protein kinase [Nocardia sp. CDC160]|uniref:serine/threonine-protein kinase n=1 Tax=Nocardia sp. CDC160 TaxID=3112166 RepID=UPI002DBBD2C5|nr:serine/threonine-protein kinase [Nocardia sp. CDC160]MEC3919414.1 serine/threonine-protein kinase [Nocardia sp. CDC160]